MSDNKTEYLGDSVYADYSTGILRLFTFNGETEQNEIFVDSGTLTNFFKYIEKTLQVKIKIKPAAAQNQEKNAVLENNK
jgi:hypothetical protein